VFFVFKKVEQVIKNHLISDSRLVSEEKMAAGVLKSGLLPRYILVPCRLKNTCRHIYTIQVCRRQREYAGVLWIRVRKDPHHFGPPERVAILVRQKESPLW
jgi:hypothetical protein